MVCGVGTDDRVYVIEDLSGKYLPDITAFSIVETAMEKIAIIRGDAKLSREGQVSEIMIAMGNGPIPHMRQIKAGNDRDLAGIKSEREGMRRDNGSK